MWGERLLPLLNSLERGPSAHRCGGRPHYWCLESMIAWRWPKTWESGSHRPLCPETIDNIPLRPSVEVTTGRWQKTLPSVGFFQRS